MSTHGEVSLEERIWMHKLCENNRQAEEIVNNLLKGIN
tara:strand:- start:793 stop:906 length:114 start_codon:yes stop_codon:yes gene_type:complete